MPWTFHNAVLIRCRIKQNCFTDSAAFPMCPGSDKMKLLQETNQALLTSIPSCNWIEMKNNNDSSR